MTPSNRQQIVLGLPKRLKKAGSLNPREGLRGAGSPELDVEEAL